nr:arginine deiminase family protein [Jeotgalibacillus soli]
MTIKKVINETQKHFLDHNIDRVKAMEQHNTFMEVLKTHGAEIIQFPPLETFPEQVFTRDIGFTIGDTVFVSTMGNDIRRGEESLLLSWLQGAGEFAKKIESHSIEGGDVVIDQSTVWVGVSKRTTEAAIKELQGKLPQHEVIAVPFDSKYLHLDCLFNVISPTDALIYIPAFSKESRDLFGSRYSLIEVNEKEQFTMGPNVLSIGNGKIISLPENQQLNEKLRHTGYEVIEVDISEIIKSGGSFRCCTLPINRA